MDIDEKQTLIHKKQHRSPEYMAINPLGKIPCLKVHTDARACCSSLSALHAVQLVDALTLLLQEGDFVLPESAAILRYLCNSRHAADHWYPADAKKRAGVDAALDW